LSREVESRAFDMSSMFQCRERLLCANDLDLRLQWFARASNRIKVMRAALTWMLIALGRVCAQDLTFTIDAVQDRHLIPSAVYGVNDSSISGSTLHRHGGNRHTGLNWENNASNAGTDYLNSSDSFLGSNVGIGNSQTSGALLQAWLDADRVQGLKSIITLPLAGYVAADMNGSVSAAETAPSARWKQLVVDKPGPLSLMPDKSDGVVYLEEMVNFLIVRYGTAAGGGVAAYCLDNEPALWPSTHPRIHPNATGYQELVSRHTAVALMTTSLDSTAQIYGPVLYGWNAHLNLQNAPDAGAYNNTYSTFTNYYLAQMKVASDAAGRRLLHRYDMHWYPEARGDHRIVFEATSPSYGTINDIDARLQAPRSLWDPSYKEISWITQYTTNGEGIYLFPRLQSRIDQYFPGTGLATTEYNYGGTEHISGGVTQADLLGIYGRYQVAACFWPLIADNSYVGAAFRLYRNYDGAGSAFGSVSLDASASDNAMGAVHAARVNDGKLTVVAINRSRTQSHTAQFTLSLLSGQSITAVTGYRLSAGGGATVQPLASNPSFLSSAFSDSLPAMTATLYDVQTTVPGFTGWRQAQFGADASNPAIAGENADIDHDDLPNLLEYLTNRNPKVADGPSPILVTIVAPAGGNPARLQLQFQRRRGVTDVPLLVQSSGALTAGSWVDLDPATLNPVVTDIDVQTEQWTLLLPLAPGRQFYRLKGQH
jgi:hypothetical protein